MLVETIHHLGATVHGWGSLVLWQMTNSVTAKSANLTFVNNPSFCIRIGVDVRWSQKTFKIANQIEIKRMLFVVIVKFYLAVIRFGIN